MRNRQSFFHCPSIGGLIFSVLLMLSLVHAHAQTITANIHGIVTDPSGAAVPKATITATNVDTGVKVSSTSNEGGNYSIRFLQIGNYQVSVEAKGFSKNTYGPYKLEIGQEAKVDAILKVGSEAVNVEVTENLTPILNTTNSQMDTTFDENTIKNIPLNGQNFSSLMIYMPGAVATQPANFSGVGAVERQTGSSSTVSVNGNRNQTNNYLWDGVEINETINNLIGYSPSPDAIQEMKVVTATPNAEYGNASGGDVVMVMKGGTNKFHGTAFGYLQNSNLDSNSWQHKHVPTGSAFAPRDAYTQTQFGASVGGPILKNKFFFFADFAMGNIHRSGTQQLYLASAKMRTGDFSELLDPSIMCSSGLTDGKCGNLIQLYDPVNGFAPYEGNKNVPILNPVAKYLYAHPELYPLPNHAPDQNSPVAENFFGISKSFNRYYQGDVRVDYTPTARDRFFGHFSQADGFDGTPVYPVPVFFQNGSDYPDKIIAVGNTHTFSSSIVNEFRAGFSRIRWNQGNPIDNSGVFGTKGNSVVGIGNSANQPFQGFAAQQVSVLNTPGNPAGGTNFIDNTFHYTELLTWQKNKQLIKIGGEFVRYQQNNFYPGNDGALGAFYYTGVFSSNPSVGAPGYSVADFVLDRIYQKKIGGVAGRTGQRQWRTAYFIQDDWRVLPNLTLNLGVRYEFDQPIYEVNDKMANVDLQTGNVIYAGKIPASNTVAGAGVCPNRACYNATYNNIMPRVGFAYQISPKAVVRAGYGITNYLEGTGANLRLTYNPPFQPSLELTGTAPSNDNAGVFFTAETGFTTQGTPNYSATTYRAWDKNLKPAFINTFSLSTQYQISNQSSLTLAYVGETGAHLIQAVASNQLKQPCFLNGVFQLNPNTPECAIAAPAPFQALVGQNGSVVSTFSQAMYNYNALQVQYRQRAMKGLELTANYTYGRAMTNSDGFFGVPNINGPSPYAQNAYDNGAEYGPVGQDIRNNFTANASYDLPFGHGRMFAANVNRAVDEVIGGWRLSGTAIVYSGFPATPYSNYNYAGTNNRAIRPNQYFKIPVKHRSSTNWFGTDPSILGCSGPGQKVNDNGVACAYGTADNGQYGTAKPNSLRTPGYQQFDFSLFKDFQIYEAAKINFRVDAFNAFNHPSLGNPDTTVTNGTFGNITNTRSPVRNLQLSAKFIF